MDGERESIVLISSDQVAQKLGIASRTVRYWTASGRLPGFVCLYGRGRWRADVLDAWIRDGCQDVAMWEGDNCGKGRQGAANKKSDLDDAGTNQENDKPQGANFSETSQQKVNDDGIGNL